MEWPILLIGSQSRADSELFEMLVSKGWSLELVSELEKAKVKAARTEYLAIVLEKEEQLRSEQSEALFQIRKLQPLAPVFIYSPGESNSVGSVDEVGQDKGTLVRSPEQVHEALSAVLRAEADQSLSQIVILCVDDAPEFLVSMRQWLEARMEEHFGLEGQPQLEFATSAEEALEIIRQLNIQGEQVDNDTTGEPLEAGASRSLGLVLSDQKMPGTTGTELLAQVKAIAPQARRALLTGHAGLDSAVTAINQKLVDRYFTKPITDHVDFTNGIVHLLNEYLLSSREKWYTERLRAQYEFARDLSARDNLNDVLNLTVGFTAEILQCRRVSLMLIEDGQLVVRAQRGLPTDLDLEKIRIPVGQGVSGSVVQSRLPRYNRDKDRDLAYCGDEDSAVELSFRVFASVPLMLAPLRMNDIPLGVINVTERKNDRSFTRDEAVMLAYIADTVSIAINNQLNQREVENLYYQAISSLALAMESKDRYTAGHSQRVHDYAVGTAKHLDLSEEQVELIGKAALLHDLGKISVPDQVIDKPGPLTDEEFKPMARHPAEGARIIKALSFLRPLLPIVRSHHERIDGTGYPDNLDAEELPLEARIVAVADTADAMTSDRPYRKALPDEEMLAELERVSGTQLDAECVQAFVSFWKSRSIRGSIDEDALASADAR